MYFKMIDKITSEHLRDEGDGSQTSGHVRDVGVVGVAVGPSQRHGSALSEIIEVVR